MAERDAPVPDPADASREESRPDYSFYNSLHIIREERDWRSRAVKAASRFPPWLIVLIAGFCVFGIIGYAVGTQEPSWSSGLILSGIVASITMIVAVILRREVPINGQNTEESDVPSVESEDE